MARADARQGARRGPAAFKPTAAFLGGIAALVTGALGIIGLGESDISRAAINHPRWTLLAFFLIVSWSRWGS